MERDPWKRQISYYWKNHYLLELAKQETIKVRKRRIREITIPDRIRECLINDARRMAFRIEEFCKTPLQDRVFGARALHQLTSYIKAIALRNDEESVSDAHYELFKHITSYFNYDCSLILPQMLQIVKRKVFRN